MKKVVASANLCEPNAKLYNIFTLLNDSDLTANELCDVIKESNRLYSLRVNTIVQNFPVEIWSKILNKTFTSGPHFDTNFPFSLLPYRLICKSWNLALSTLKTLRLPVAPNPRPFLGDILTLFPLTSLSLTLNTKILDFSLIQNLKKLTLLAGWRMEDECSRPKVNQSWDQLTQLTQLTTLHLQGVNLYDAPALLAGLPNLKNLTLHDPPRSMRLSLRGNPLKSLQFLEIGGDNSDSFKFSDIQGLKNLTRLVSTNLDLFHAVRNGCYACKSHAYDGSMLGGRYHGLGTLHEYACPGTYGRREVDETVFEGEHDRGNKLHGTLTNKTRGWVFQGFFEVDQPRSGVMTWIAPAPDGPCEFEGIWSPGDDTEDEYPAEARKKILKGNLTMMDGTRYNGIFHEQEKTGRLLLEKGTVEYPNGMKYDGEMKDGVKGGQGCQVYTNGDVYRGKWWGDVPHGEGRLEYVHEGRTWTGQFLWGLKEGKGVQETRYGSRWEGRWEGRMTFGTHTRPKGAEDPSTTQVHSGSLKTLDGDYEGDYLSILGTTDSRVEFPHGRGTIHYSNGNRYEGDWYDGIPHGQGKMTDKEGSYAGPWEHGDRTGANGVFIDQYGLRYEGTFLDGLLHGPGTHQGPRWSSGDTPMILSSQGAWKFGALDGQSSCVFQDGSTYVGGWVEDFPIGEGALTFPSGHQVVGTFGRELIQAVRISADGTRSLPGTFEWDKATRTVQLIKDPNSSKYHDYDFESYDSDY